MISVETAVVGGGPAGAAAACGLAAAGREVILLERAAGPRHKVCGEFLGPGTQASLARLGIDLEALGAAAIDDAAIISGARFAAAALPFRALSLSRWQLDDALRKRAAELGARVRLDTPVRRAERYGGGWGLICGDGTTIGCRYLVHATGKQALRGIPDERDRSTVGLKIHLRLVPEAISLLSGRIELHLFASGYAGLCLIEQDVANLCLLLPGRQAARIGPGWPAWRSFLASAAPTLARRLEGAESLWAAPLAVGCPAGGHLAGSQPESRFYPVGDRLAHMPAFAGEGLAVALRSGVLAAEFIRDGRGAAEYLAAAGKVIAPAMRRAGAVGALAAAPAAQAVLVEAAARLPALMPAIARLTRLPRARFPRFAGEGIER